MAGMVADGITIKFSANTSGLTDGAKKAQDVIGGFAKIGATALLAVGAAAVAGGIAATKMAGDFQAGMTSLVTGAGESTKNIKMVGAGILDLATQTGTSTKQLTDGMYMIESAGFHGADGLNVLKSAAMGAKVGNADLAAVANGVTTALTDYAMPASKASAVTNDLIATVASGKTTMQALSTAMSTILPTAASVGVGLTDVSGAMATMTGQGTGAAQASTYLRQLLMALENPAKKGADALASIGLKSADVAAEMKVSLPGALTMITDHLKTKFPEGSSAYIKALADISGGSKQMQGMLQLTGTHLNVFKGNVESISDAVKQGGDSINGWSNVQSNFNFKMDRAREVVETLGIKLGTKLLPMVANLLDKIMPVITSFGDWLIKSGALENGFNMLVGAVSGVINAVSNVVSFFQQNHAALAALQTILIVVAGVIAGLLVYAFVAATIAAWNMAVAVFAATWEFILVGAIVAAVIAVVVLAFQHWGAITKWFQGIWAAVSSWFMGILGAIGAFFVGLWQGLANWFIGMWKGIITGLTAAWNFIVNVIKIGALLALAVLFAPILIMAGLFIWLYQHNTYFKMLVDAIVNFFKACFTWLQGAWKATIDWLVGAWHSVVGVAGNVWNQVSGAIKTAFSAAIGFVAWVWGVISSYFSNAWNNYIAGPLASLWSTVSTFFSGVWSTYIAGPIGDLWNSLTTTIGGWATKAVDWGKNLIQSFVNGIVSMASSVAGAVGGIAGKVLAFLGFHSPTKEGPGHEADVWAPNFIKMYAKGLTAGLPQIQDAVNKLSTPLALNFNSRFQYPSGAASAAAPQIVVHVHNDKPAPIYLDGYELNNRLAPHQANMMRLKGDIRSR